MGRFRLVRIENIARLQNKCDSKIVFFGRTEKIVGKGDNAGLTMFSKDLYLEVIKTQCSKD